MLWWLKIHLYASKPFGPCLTSDRSLFVTQSDAMWVAGRDLCVKIWLNYDHIGKEVQTNQASHTSVQENNHVSASLTAKSSPVSWRILADSQVTDSTDSLTLQQFSSTGLFLRERMVRSLRTLSPRCLPCPARVLSKPQKDQLSLHWTANFVLARSSCESHIRRLESSFLPKCFSNNFCLNDVVNHRHQITGLFFFFVSNIETDGVIGGHMHLIITWIFWDELRTAGCHL